MKNKKKVARKDQVIQIYVRPDEMPELKSRLANFMNGEDRPVISNAIIFLLKKALADMGY